MTARRLPAHCALLALFAFQLTVVLTPRQEFGAFAGYLAVLLLAAAVAGVPWPAMARRLPLETPFLLFALVLPVTGPAPRTVAGLSVPGLLAAWNVIAKATLGVLAAGLLAAVTTPTALLAGLRRLRAPATLVEIAGTLLRYSALVTGELARTRVAMLARGHRPRDIRAAPAMARAFGALFLRCYSRGERIHHAMLARGYTGTPPAGDDPPARPTEWLVTAAIPGTAVLLAVFA